MANTSATATPTVRGRPRWLPAAAIVGVAALSVGGYFGGRWLLLTPVEELIVGAELALDGNRNEEALRLAGEAAERDESPQALLLAGEAASRLRRIDEALGFYSRIADDGTEDAVEALVRTGQIKLHLGRVGEAEQSFRQALARQPTQTLALHRLAFILAVEGRREESAPYLFELLKQRATTVEELILLGNLEPDYELPDELERWRKAVPNDPLPLLGKARPLIRRGKDEGKRLVEAIVARDSDRLESQTWLGLYYVFKQDQAALVTWQAALPSQAEEYASIWAIRGRMAVTAGDGRGACRCFWEAVRRDPNHELSNYHVATLLTELGDETRAAPFRERFARLHELSDNLRDIYPYRENLDALPDGVKRLRDTGRLTKELGHLWESRQWCWLIVKLDSKLEWAWEEMDRLDRLLAKNPPRTLAESNPAVAVDLSDLPLPKWERTNGGSYEAAPAAAGSPRIAFANQAAEAGIDAVYYTGRDPNREGRYLREAMGGGLAVLDYDGDTWPDLYFTQACDFPVDESARSHVDRFYRNVHGTRYEDVTEAAGLGDNRFSDGVAAGDFNCDGFADLLVGNLGRNTLYLNNGDGTFSDVTERAGIGGERWTTSCLIADLNGDTWPDLFEVNYLEGTLVHTTLCQYQGRPRICAPHEFNGEQDRLWLNLGDGRFEDVSEAAGIFAPRGNGLGIVAADFDGSGRLSLYVANDETPNFYFANLTSVRGDRPKFEERGLISGLALNRDGVAQASMGIAADDMTGDGLLDLLVTNFENEGNAFYERLGDWESFSETSQARGVRGPSLEMLGFGTQCIDADLDGRPDAIVTNGHVEDYSFQSRKFQMRPQFFYNTGDGQFVELPSDVLGPFFSEEYLGRGLARLDWNRDGKEEAAISHIDAAAALLTNRTEEVGHFLAVQFRGTVSDRDAIGTTITIQAGGKTLVRQLTAGDGFQASNQRQIVVGLGSAERVDELKVRWPSGLEQTFADLKVDREIVLIEGRSEPYDLPGADSF